MNATCVSCGAANPAAARFCRQCGQALPGHRVRSLTRVTPLLERWRRLSHALTRKEVRTLLGEPRRIETTQSGTESTETWEYDYQKADDPAVGIAGQVTFSVAESRVISWTEPDWDQIGG